MENFNRLKIKDCVDSEAECLYQYVYGVNDVYNPHCHEFYEIVVVASGTVVQETNGKILSLSEGSLVFVRPDDVHGYIYDTPESKKSAYINLAFSKETAEKLFDFLFDEDIIKSLLLSDMPPIVVLNEYEKNRVLEQVGRLNLVNCKNKKDLKLEMRAILADIFVHFFYNISKPDTCTAPEWLSQLVEAMKRPDNFIAGTQHMIKLSKKSREHLARSLKTHYGVTISEFINSLRINYASNLLIHTNINIIDICYECGFQSLSIFYKLFKDKYNISPKAFRIKYIQM